MNGCIYKQADGKCKQFSVGGVLSYCVEGPCDCCIPSNADRIRAMTDEELAEYLFDRGNGCEYCYGICAYQDECDGLAHAQEFCIEQIVKWLNASADGERKDDEQVSRAENP